LKAGLFSKPAVRQVTGVSPGATDGHALPVQASGSRCRSAPVREAPPASGRASRSGPRALLQGLHEKGPGRRDDLRHPGPSLAARRSAPPQEAEPACKPGSVRLAARQSFLSARRRRLAPATYPGTTRAALSFPYSVLLRVGFTVPCDVDPARGALLPHPFTLTCALAGHRRSALCCTGRQLALPRRYLAPCPVEPGLSSTHL